MRRLAAGGMRTGWIGGVGLVAQDPAFVYDEDQIGVAAGAAEGVTAPILNGILHVEDGGAVFGIELEVGDVSVARLDKDGVGALEGFGKAGVFLVFGLRDDDSNGGDEKREECDVALHD